MSTDESAFPDGQPALEPIRLAGRYELGAELGRGGMAVVRRATDLRLGRVVAVKVLRGELTDAPAFQARFRREARAVAALDHPSVVRVYDAGEETVGDTSMLYIVMEYVDGQTLSHLLRTGPRLTHRRALEITADVLDALDESHRAGIVHRDVKPGNVMVTATGAVKVMDFGVARAIADMSATVTQTATVIGTAHYLSPEQARGDSVDARSDVYSAGCLLYELLTGRPPFQGDSAVAVAYQHVRETPQPPSAFEPEVTPEIDSVVLAALAKQPDTRYQSAAAMRSDLMAVLAGDRLAAPMTPVGGAARAEPATDEVDSTVVGLDYVAAPEEAGSSAEKQQRRRKAGYLTAAAATVLVLSIGGFTLGGLGGSPDGGANGQQPVPVKEADQNRAPQSAEQSSESGTSQDGLAEADDVRRDNAGRDPGDVVTDAEVEQTASPTDARTVGQVQVEPSPRYAPSSSATSAPAPSETTTSAPEETPTYTPPPESTAPEPTPSEESPEPTSSPTSDEVGP